MTPGSPFSWHNQTLVHPRPEPPRIAWNGVGAGPGRPLTDELCALLGVAPGSVWGSYPSTTAPLPPGRHDDALLFDSDGLAAAAGRLPPALPAARAPARATTNLVSGLPGTPLTDAQRAALGAAPGAVWGASAGAPAPPPPHAAASAGPPAVDVDAARSSSPRSPAAR